MNKLWISIVLLGFVSTVAQASETIFEKLASSARSEGRKIEEGNHRMQEMLCFDGFMTCTLKKGVNRAKEVGSAIGDGVVDLKNKVD